MSVSLSEIRSRAVRLLGALLVRHLRGWQEAWSIALQGPYLWLGVIGLTMGVLITGILVPAAFDIGIMTGISYLMALYFAFSNAIFVRVVRIDHGRIIPVGVVAPIFILVGVIGSGAIRPLIGDAKNAALAQDFISAVVIFGVFVGMTLWFRQWQSGNPY